MKKILASIVALTAVTGFAGVAHAGGSATSTTVGTPASQTSIHTGSVGVNCTIVVGDASLPTATTLVSDLTSTSAANISTICNTPAASLTIVVGAVIAGDEPSATQVPVRTFSVQGVNGAYLGITAPFSNTYTQSNVSNNFSSATSNLGVIAKIAAPTGQNLAAGSYTARILATLTP